MNIEVVIPAYKPGRSIEKVIDALLNQSIAVSRIRLVFTIDSDVEHGEYDYLNDEFVEVDYCKKQDFGHGKTRQICMEQSDADYVLMMTQDALPYDGYLIEKLLEAFNDSDVAVAYSRQIPYADADSVERFSRLYNYPARSHMRDRSDLEKYGVKAIFCSDTCAMYKTSVHRGLGGFDENTDFAEDAIFAYRALLAGYKVAYVSDAKVYHSHNYSFRQHFERNRHIAQSQKQHPEIYNQLRSESEGKKYIKTGLKYFIGKKDIIGAGELFLTGCVRYAGYLCGKLGF